MTALIDFSDPREAGRWHDINDGVMGGVSRGGLRGDGDIGVFEGHVSLENNGGFASVRRERGDHTLDKAAGLRLRVRGDGRRYQLRLHTDALRDDGAAYRGTFDTSGEWQTVTLPWHAFEPVFRGRLLTDAPPLPTGPIRQFGLMIADRRAGDFRLEIALIDALA